MKAEARNTLGCALSLPRLEGGDHGVAGPELAAEEATRRTEACPKLADCWICSENMLDHPALIKPPGE